MKAVLSCNFIMTVWARLEKEHLKKKKFCDVFLIDFSVGYGLTLLSFSFHQKNEWWAGTKQKHSVCVQFTLCFDKQRSIQGKFLRAALFKLNLLTTVLNVNTILLYIFYLEKYVLINLLLMKCNCQFLNLFICFVFQIFSKYGKVVK